MTWSRAAIALLLVACSASTEPLPLPPPPPPPTPIRIVTFGDSNTGNGWDGMLQVEASYITPQNGPPGFAAPNGPHSLAGKIEARSDSAAGFVFHAVNHGVTSTGTGLGRSSLGSPNARTVWLGITRFEAEVLGAGGTAWDGGDGMPRVEAFVPSARDYAYVSMGTNDWEVYGMDAAATVADLTWMADRWIAAGLPPKHLIITTLAPKTDTDGGHEIPAINAGVRALASAKGVSLIDLAAYSSADDGVTWRSPELTVDGVHYADPVRSWLARQVVAIARTP